MSFFCVMAISMIPEKANEVENTMTDTKELPIAVIGAGPVGLAAAAELISRGERVKVYEAAQTVGAHLREWGHVRLFSPWRYNTAEAAVRLLTLHGWTPPDPDLL